MLAAAAAALAFAGACSSDDAGGDAKSSQSLQDSYSIELPADWNDVVPATSPWRLGEPPYPDAVGADTYHQSNEDMVITVARRGASGKSLRDWAADLQTTGTLDNGCAGGATEESTLGGGRALLSHYVCTSDHSFHQFWITRHGKYGYAVLCGSLTYDKAVTDKKCRALVSTFRFTES